MTKAEALQNAMQALTRAQEDLAALREAKPTPEQRLACAQRELDIAQQWVSLGSQYRPANGGN